MKKIYYLILTTVIVSACSTPKYTASFNSYESYTAKSANKSVESPQTTPINNTEVVLASTSSAPVEISNTATPVATKKTYVQMTNAERKALRSHLRSEIKTYVKNQKKKLEPNTVNATHGMDNDLKLAAIFGAVGIVALIIGGDVFWIIGGVAMLIGVVFFVKWLVRQ